MAKPKASPAAKAKRVPRIPVFELRLGPELLQTYILLIHMIYVEIARILREENDDLPKQSRIPMRVAGNLFTPSGGIFLVRIIPEDPEEGVLTLLFRFRDLYFESYHFDDVWYRLTDHDADLPPKELIPYRDVQILRGISTSYANLGGYCPIGKPAFRRCYHILSSTAMLLTTRRGLALLTSGPLSLPANGISEAVRFRVLEKWVKRTLRGESDLPIPNDISLYFTEWGDSSKAMYTKKVPSFCKLTMGELRKRMGVLLRRDMVEVKDLECANEKPEAFVLNWHQQDRKRMLQASISVSSLDHTVSYYKNCFEMKLLRLEDAAEGSEARAIMGFEPEVKSFVLHLEQQEKRVHQDHDKRIEKLGNPVQEDKKPMGFGHFAIAHSNVQSLVDTIILNGGNVTHYAVKDGPSVSASAEDPDGYKFELLQRGPTPERICQLMLHVTDIERAIKFYERALGMKLLAQNRVFKGQGCTLIARMGYGEEHIVTILELRSNYGVHDYSKENGYKQITIGTNDVQMTGKAIAYTIKRMGGQILEGPGSLPISKVEMISFADPDGWNVIVVDKNDFLTERP